MGENKAGFASIDDYISQLPSEVQQTMQALREAIRETAPEATERISYQIPTFALQGNLVHFAAFKNHVGFYPGANGIAAFEQQLAGYKKAKGSVQFPIDQPLPFDLIKTIVSYRVAQNMEKAAAKRKKAKSGS